MYQYIRADVLLLSINFYVFDLMGTVLEWHIPVDGVGWFIVWGDLRAHHL